MNPSVSNNLKMNDNLKKKIKIFLGIGCLGMMLVGGLILWAGIATVQQVAKIGSKVNVQEQVGKFKGGISEIPVKADSGCWQKVQSLMDIQVWIDTPPGENITSLRDACFEPDSK